MASAVIDLTESEKHALRALAMKTGKSAEELLHEAVARFLLPDEEERRALMQQARGIWQGRDDLPAVETLRAEFERRHEMGG